MVEGVITRLQKDVAQLQKDVASIKSKLDGVTEQMRAEIKSELEQGMLSVQKELEKMFFGMLSKVTSISAGKSIFDVLETGSPVETQKSVSNSTVVATASQRTMVMELELEKSNSSGELAKINPRRSKLDCPKFDGYDFLGWRLKVEQFFEAMDLVKEEKVQTAMIHLEGKAL